MFRVRQIVQAYHEAGVKALIRLTERELAQLQVTKPAEAPYNALRPPRPPRPVASADPRPIKSMTIELPLPSSKCSPNAANALGHWSVSNKARMEYKEECLTLLPKFAVPLFERARIDLTFYLAPCAGRYHPRDEWNASSAVKGLVDSLVQSGIIPDDSKKYLTAGTITLLTRQAEHHGKACVLVVLERIA